MKNDKIKDISEMDIEDILEKQCLCKSLIDIGDIDCGCKIIINLKKDK